jgi:peptidyl-prolyl cis-trans isomerase SurA
MALTRENHQIQSALPRHAGKQARNMMALEKDTARTTGFLPNGAFRTLLCKTIRPARALALALSMLAAGVLTLAVDSGPALAQRLVATVNDAPITNYDVAQRIKLLRVLREKATSASALESLIEDRLKAGETKKYTINPTDQQIIEYAARDGQKRKLNQNRFAFALQRSVDQLHWKDHYRSQLAWDTLIGALFKSVNVSTREVDAELARRGSKTSKTQYVLRQVILVVPRNAGAGALQARLREANGLRARFRDCNSGAALARGLRDVAVQTPVTRRAADLTPQLIKLLDSTPVGRLTSPQRGVTGIEMIAVCSKSDTAGRVAAGNTIRNELLEKKLSVQSKRRYEDLRRKAIIIRR